MNAPQVRLARSFNVEQVRVVSINAEQVNL
jgi:hypothetical protein